jgi:hypothetical protein
MSWRTISDGDPRPAGRQRSGLQRGERDSRRRGGCFPAGVGASAVENRGTARGWHPDSVFRAASRRSRFEALRHGCRSANERNAAPLPSMVVSPFGSASRPWPTIHLTSCDLSICRTGFWGIGAAGSDQCGQGKAEAHSGDEQLKDVDRMERGESRITTHVTETDQADDKNESGLAQGHWDLRPNRLPQAGGDWSGFLGPAGCLTELRAPGPRRPLPNGHGSVSPCKYAAFQSEPRP